MICKKVTSNLGISSHVRITHEGKTDFIKQGNKGRHGKPSWSKGKTLSSEYKAKISSALIGHSVDSKTRLKISDSCKGKTGGVREGGGRGKKGYYQGIYCDSSWELAFVIFHLKNGNKIERVKEPRTYVFEGKIRKYYPDFTVNGKTFEIKGWKTSQWLAKETQNPDIIVLGFEEIKPMLDFAILKYGKDFTKAYGEC